MKFAGHYFSSLDQFNYFASNSFSKTTEHVFTIPGNQCYCLKCPILFYIPIAYAYNNTVQIVCTEKPCPILFENLYDDITYEPPDIEKSDLDKVENIIFENVFKYISENSLTVNKNSFPKRWQKLLPYT